MKVLLISENLWPHGGGGELATYLFTKKLISKGFQVKIIIGNKNLDEMWVQLAVYNIGKIGYGKYFIPDHSSALLIKKLAKESDIIYFTGLFNLIPIVKSLQKPIISHLHSYFPICPVGHLYNFATQSICSPNKRNCFNCILNYEVNKKSLYEASISALANKMFSWFFLKQVLISDALIFVSKKQRELFINYLKKMSKEKKTPSSYVIYNLLPDLDYTPLEGRDIGFLGGTDPIKGIDPLLRAWKILHPKYKNINLRIANASKLSHNFQKINIKIYPHLRGNQLEQFFALCGTIVIPSICPEPSPYVILESLLRGRPIITTDTGGIPEMIDNAPGIKLVVPNDVETMVDAIEWSLTMDRETLMELGYKNREYILNKFDNERTINELISIFYKVR